MLGQLIPSGGGLPIPLLKESIIVGRAPDCDVVLSSGAISGHHCTLTLRNGFWWVTDLESRNGTGINGIKCREQRILPNETLCVPKMRFQFVYEAPADDDGKMTEDLALRVLGAPSAVSTPLEPDSAVIANSAAYSRPAEPRRATMQTAVPRPEGSVRRYLGKLVPEGGGDPIPLLQSVLLIGRSRNSDIRLKFSTVSGRHCTLTWKDGYWYVEDLSSSNGVKINGERVDRRHLMPGDQLAISSQRFTIDYTAEGPPPVDPGLMSKSLLEKAGLQNILKSEKAPGWITAHEKQDEDAPRRYKLDDSDPD